MDLARYHTYDGEHVTCRTLCEMHGHELFKTTDMVYVSMCEITFHKTEDYCEECYERASAG